MNKSLVNSLFWGLSLLLCVTTSLHAGEEVLPIEYEDDDVHIRLVIRTPDQLAAFYTGREFPQFAIDEILKPCFITPIVLNKTFEALWVEPDSWNFELENTVIQRIKRDYWKKIWRDTGLSLAHQSTFGWTLMPESRDLRLDEGVGGSIVIPMQNKPITLKMHFKTGLNKEGKTHVVTFRDISCAQ